MAKENTAALKEIFLAKYADIGPPVNSIAQAAKNSGVTFQQVYAWKKKDPDFAEQLELIEMMIADEIGTRIKERALMLEDKKDATLAIYFHKGKRPEFRDNARQVVISGELSLKDKCKKNAKR